MIDPTRPDYTNTPVSRRRPPFGYALAEPHVLPAVSIVTPFFNTGAEFYETAQSVLQQSLQQWQWIIVNDGSTDEQSLAILDRFRHLDPRICVIDHPQNQGAPAARNTGFAAAAADIIVQLDSDDLLEPTTVEKWFWLLTSYPEYAFANGYSVLFQARQSLLNGRFSSPRAFLLENEIIATCGIRKSVHQAVGGYDTTLRHGFDDTDFWLRCASAGLWGARVPEYTDWYRQREYHGDRWESMRSEEHIRRVRFQLYKRYPNLWHQTSFPQISIRPHLPYASIPTQLPCANRLRKEKPRLLIITGGLQRGAGWTPETALLEHCMEQGWEPTVALVDGDGSCLPVLTQFTPDVFLLPNFLRLVDYPRFLRYLILSRQTDVVLISASAFGYLLLPYLQAYYPQVGFVGLCPQSPSGHDDLLRLAVECRNLLDMIIVTSEEAKLALQKQGVDEEQIAIWYGDEGAQDGCQDVTSLMDTVRDRGGRQRRVVSTPEMGHIFACLSVERMREEMGSSRLITATDRDGRRTGFIPTRLKRLLNRLVLWGVYPDPRLATLLRAVKSIVPTPVKVALKRSAK